MYFLLGAAKVLSAHHGGYGWLAQRDAADVGGRPASPADPAAALGGGLVAMEKNVGGSMLLALTANTVFLWCTRPSVMISKCRRRAVSLQAEGANASIVWKPDSTAFAVVTASGKHIHLYDVLLPGQSYPAPYATPSSAMAGAPEGNGPPRPGTPAPRERDETPPARPPPDAPPDTRLFRYEFVNDHVSASAADEGQKAPHGFVTGPGEGGGVPARRIRFRGSVDVSAIGGIACAFALADEIVVSTRGPAGRLVSYPWFHPPGIGEPSHSVDLSSLNFLRRQQPAAKPSPDAAEEDLRLVSVWPDKSSELFVWALRRGADPRTEAYFVQRRRKTSDRTRFTWNGIALPADPGEGGRFTAAAINTRHLLVALGTDAGKVLMLSISDSGKSGALSHALGDTAQRGAGGELRPRGQVTDVDFSADGLAVACGFAPIDGAGDKGGGVGIWSTYGRWLAGTVGGPADADGLLRGFEAPGAQGDAGPWEEDGHWMRGVGSLFWGVGSYELFLLPAGPQPGGSDDWVTDIYVLPMAKLPLTGCPNLVTAQHLYLQMDDRFLIHTTALSAAPPPAKAGSGTPVLPGVEDLDATVGRHPGFASPLLGLGVTFGSALDLSADGNPGTPKRGTLRRVSHQEEHRSRRGHHAQDNSMRFSLDPEMSQWFSVQLPTAYISSNWPVKYSAPSPGMAFVAAAGRRGFAVYAVRSNRWRMFGNEVQESSFAVKGGLAWWEPGEFAGATLGRTNVAQAWNPGAVLIVPCLDLAVGESKLRFFQATGNLDLSTCLATQKMAKGVVCMDVRDDTLLVYSADNVVRVFSLEIGLKPTVVVRLHHQFSLGSCVPFPATVQSVFWLPATKTLFSYYSTAALQQQPVAVLNHGKLYLVKPSFAEAEERPTEKQTPVVDAVPPRPGSAPGTLPGTPSTSVFPIFGSAASLANGAESPTDQPPFLHLADGIEFVYLTSANERLGNYLLSTLWTVSGSAIRAWINFGMTVGGLRDGGAAADLGDAAHGDVEGILDALGGTVEPTLEFPVDFYPFGIAVPKGIVTGLSQHVSLRTSSDVVSFKAQTETNLWLPRLLRYLLAHDLEEVAAEVARYYSNLDYFAHALEVLLHEVLDDEAPKYVGYGKGALLPRVIAFLRGLPHYLEVIVQCARKTEYALWEYLFSIVGDAKNLFEQCLEQRQLRTATSYLIILQTLEPSSVSSRYAVELLERSFESEDYELCKELVRFLSSITTSVEKGAASGWLQQISAKAASARSSTGGSVTGLDAGSEAGSPDSPPTMALDHKFPKGQLIADTPAGHGSPILVAGQSRSFSGSDIAPRSSGDYANRTLPDGTDLFYIEILVSRHARNLLSKYRVRALGKLASSLRYGSTVLVPSCELTVPFFSFPLTSWLAKERTRSGIVANWRTALAALHQQFAIPLPDDYMQLMTSVAGLPSLVTFLPPAEAGDLAAFQSPSVASPTSPMATLENFFDRRRYNTVAALETSGEPSDPPDVGEPRRSMERTLPASAGSAERIRASFFESLPVRNLASDHPLRTSPIGTVSRLSSMPAVLIERQAAAADAALKLRMPGQVHSSTLRHYREVAAELKELQEAMRTSGCVEWLVLLSTLLGDVGSLVEAFMGIGLPSDLPQGIFDEDLFSKWSETLEGTNSSGYQKLLQITQTQISTLEPAV
ncbi:RIC1-domain-containing protein [Hyaloraphidium curvatum]|nr:RIC1-domain-containing protein [Hyaloraphidium curvatum]